MFKFNLGEFRIRYVMLHGLSKATIDPKVTYLDEAGVKHRLPIPVSIARIVRARLQGVTKFTKGYPACFGMMGDRIVAMDVAVGPHYKMFKEFDEWISCIESRAEHLKALEGDWLYDGQYAYRTVGEVQPLGETGFGSQDVRCINLYRLGEEKGDLVENLSLLAYKHPETEQWVKSAPVTRKSGSFLQITGDNERFNKDDQFIDSDELARLDKLIFPNLRFVTYAAKVITAQFGYEAVEPLGLPILMIEHQTFNVGGIPTEMQAASPAPMSFTNALAWMIGLNLQVLNLNDLIAVKSTTKMLLTKGNSYHTIMGGKDENEEETATKELIAAVRAAASAKEMVKYESLSVEDID